MMNFETGSMISEITKKHQEAVDRHIINALKDIGSDLVKGCNLRNQNIGELLLELDLNVVHCPENTNILNQLKDMGMQLRFEHKPNSNEFSVSRGVNKLCIMYELPTVVVEITEELGRK